jgi:hypothetical protein
MARRDRRTAAQAESWDPSASESAAGFLRRGENYQGGAVPGMHVIEVRRATLREQFDDLHAVLSPDAALTIRRQKIELLAGSQRAD